MNQHTTADLRKVPRHVLRCGAVSATTWPKTRTVNGELREHAQVELIRNYRDSDGQWQKTSRFWPEDLPALIAVAQRAYEAILVSERWPATRAEDGGAETREFQPERETPVAPASDSPQVMHAKSPSDERKR